MKEIMQEDPKATTASGISRRKFLAFTGGLAGATVLLDACNKKDDETVLPTDDMVDLGKGDDGVLNYSYMMAQLHADFYFKVLASPYTDMPMAEKLMLEDIKGHEIAHREFLKNYLAGRAIGSLEFNFNDVDFTSRFSVLETARILEDLGVMAYNGSASLYVTVDNLMYATKMGSVQARHAAAIRELRQPGTFADTADEKGRDISRTPAEILGLVKQFLKSKVSGNNLPKS